MPKTARMYSVYARKTEGKIRGKANLYSVKVMRGLGGKGMTAEKPRVVQEYVPGKQVTLAHLIANPKKELWEKLGIVESSAIGILTITPCEAAIIAADVATKAAAVQIGFMDRFTGSLVLVGTVSSIEAALKQVTNFLGDNLGFSVPKLTKS